MTIALRELGWTGAYLSTASLGHRAGDRAGRRRARRARGTADSRPALSWPTVRTSLAASWAHPGTRLGFWMHFTCQFSATSLALLWGYPFLVQGEGRSEATAGVLLTLIVVAIIYSGPLLGTAGGPSPLAPLVDGAS